MKERASKTVTWDLWHGTRDDLLAIADAMARAVEPHRQRAHQANVRKHDELPRDLYKPEEIAHALQSGKSKADLKWTPAMRATEEELNYEASGSPQEVLEGLDSVRVDEIVLEVPRFLTHSAADSCHVTLNRTKGVELRVKGTDRDWVRATLATVGDTIGRGVPGYRFLRAGWFSYVYALLLGLVAFLVIIRDEQVSPLHIGLSSLTVAVAALLLHEAVRRKLIVGYELVDKGERPRARRILTGAGMLLGGAALSLVGSMLGT